MSNTFSDQEKLDVLLLQVFSPNKPLTFFPGLGLGYLAAFLKENKINVGIYNSVKHYQDKDVWIDLIKTISETNPSIIGISSTAFALGELIRISNFIKKIFPKMLLVTGGYGPTFYPDIIEEPSIDVVVLGEGEESLLKIVRKFLKHKTSDLSSIPGVITKMYDIQNTSFQYIDNLDKLPFPLRNYIDHTPYAGNILISSRGCPYRCKFCAVNKFYKNCPTKWRTRNLDSIIKEMNCLLYESDKKVQEIEFFDDEFLCDVNRAKILFEKIKKSKSLKNKKIIFAARANNIVQNKNFILNNVRNISNIFCGIESFNEDYLEKLNKYSNGKLLVEYNIKTVNLLEKYNIPTKYGFINPTNPPSVNYLEKHLPIYYRDRFISLQNLLFNIINLANYEIPYNAIEGKYKVVKNHIFKRYTKVISYFLSTIKQKLLPLHKSGKDITDALINFFFNTFQYCRDGKESSYSRAITSFDNLPWIKD